MTLDSTHLGIAAGAGADRDPERDAPEDEALGRGTTVPTRALPKAWFEVSRTRGALDVARIWVLVLATLLIGSAFDAWWSALAGIVLIGALQHHCSVLLHHAVHYNLHPRRAVNDGLARWLLAAPIGQMLRSVRTDHFAHHRLFGGRRDPERFYWDLRLDDRTRPAGLRLWMLRAFSGGLVVPLVRRVVTGSRIRAADRARFGLESRDTRKDGAEDVGDLAAVVAVQAILALGFWGIHGSPWAYLVFWVVPVLTVGAGLNALRATLEHADGATGRARFLSFAPGPVERFFLAPMGFEYHYEHHCFMTVPYYRGDRLRDFLRERGEYPEGVLVGSYRATLRELLSRR